MNLPCKNRFVLVGMITGMTSLSGLSGSILAQETSSMEPVIHPLMDAQVLLLETIALTERGLQDSSTIAQTVAKKLSDAGFTIVSSPNQSHDVVVRVKCEERQTWSGPSKQRSISPALNSRLWKGPACHISYRHEDQSPNWNWEVRTPFEDVADAAEAAGASETGAFALNALNAQLQQDDFPYFLVAEWKQTDRLLTLLQQSAGDLETQTTILQLLGDLPSNRAHEALTEALSDPDLSSTALLALGQQGAMAIPTLASYLETAPTPDLRLDAIKAMGTVATHCKDPLLFTQFMNFLETEDPKVQAEAVKGLGNLGDRRAIGPLQKLNLKAWSNPSTSEDMNALREMLSWSLWQLSPDAHTGG